MYPAIDLRHGRVVRLAQGDPHRETRYSDDALAVARRWQEAGSLWVHVVNLDGAFDEQGAENQAALERILTTGLRVQLGGGLRRIRDVRRAFEIGASRVVIGTAAVEDPAMFEAALGAFGPDRIALGIDAREGRVRTHGWQQESAISAVALACHWAARGVQWVIFTDILRDGMGSGINLAAARELARAAGVHVIVSGGVASLDDVQLAHDAGLSGIIIGRALYEGKVDLRAALRIGERSIC
ncbi:MAG: 1-(5-phosphoribosyl)-5-[(5-phosphoribosylamino)methylideneamino]imidazole-4-carboxamide isomerase [Anaerolineae bacterium]|nr:1-(5-phosphoribosyl)-5-[(5-phosphoribosylamino)methylideneamino]imidazole-4-carboxamide isomerase [Anaerolineae bacterium]